MQSSSTSSSEPARRGDLLLLVTIALALLLAEVFYNLLWRGQLAEHQRSYDDGVALLGSGRCSVVALGDSHADGVFRAQEALEVGGICNGSFFSEGLSDVAIKADILAGLPATSRPRHVLFEVDPQIFSPHRDVANNRLRWLGTAPPASLSREYGLNLSWPSRFVYRHYPLASLNNRSKALLIATERYLLRTASAVGVDGSSEGWTRLSEAQRTRQAQDRIASHFPERQCVSPAQLAAADRALAALHGAGIRVTLIHYPVAPEYARLIPRACNERLDRWVQDALSSSRAAAFLDARGWLTDPADLANADHVARSAAPGVRQRILDLLPPR
jgi:hypothetical protein